MLPGTIEELDAIRRDCESLVNKRTALSAGAAVVPIPMLDIGADVAVLLEMIPAINRKFGLTPEEIHSLHPQRKQVLLAAIGSVGSDLLGKVVTKPLLMHVVKRLGGGFASKTAAKMVPFFGQAVAASVSFGIIRYLGRAHIADCYAVAQRVIEATDITPPPSH